MGGSADAGGADGTARGTGGGLADAGGNEAAHGDTGAGPLPGAGGTGAGNFGGGTGGNFGGGGGGGASGGGDAGAAGGTAGSATQGGAGAAISLPLIVSDYYTPSGFMGDGQTVPGAVTFDQVACKLPRVAGAAGSCYKVTYRPPPLEAGQTVRWAGVYWQGPQFNWGEVPGRKLMAGARQVAFFAAGELGGETVTFKAGGIASPNRVLQPHADSFMVEKTVTLTTTWTRQSLPLGGSTYDEVIGAFCWVAEARTTAPIIFYLDGIVWEP